MAIQKYRWGGGGDGLLYYSVMVASKIPPTLLILKDDTLTYILVHILLRLKVSSLVVQILRRSFLSDERSTSPGWSCQLGLWMCSGEGCDDLFVKIFFSPKIGVSWGKTIIVGENLQFGRGERRQTFSERGRHSFTDTNTLWLIMFFNTKFSI